MVWDKTWNLLIRWEWIWEWRMPRGEYNVWPQTPCRLCEISVCGYCKGLEEELVRKKHARGLSDRPTHVWTYATSTPTTTEVVIRRQPIL